MSDRDRVGNAGLWIERCFWPDTRSGARRERSVMTATLDDVTKQKPAETSAEQQAAVEMVRLAGEQGLSLTARTGC
jgi:hypothetical protein